MRAELEAQNDHLTARLAALEEGVTKADYEKGYEVLNWWGETERNPSRISQAMHAFTREYTGSQKKFPRTILIRKTGEVRELPYPPTANKIPESASTR